MPRRASPKGAPALRNILFQIVDVYGGNRALLSRELDISYYRASKIVNAKRDNLSIYDMIGQRDDKRAERLTQQLNQAVKKSGWEAHEQKLEDQPRRMIALPPEPHGKFQTMAAPKQVLSNGERRLYDYNPNRKIRIPQDASIQIIAIGTGRAHGRDITKLTGAPGGDWKSAWANWYASLHSKSGEHFIVEKFQVLVTIPDAPMTK